MPLARIPEMAEMLLAMFDPNLTGSLREPPPQRVVIANILDHMACEGLTNLDAIMNDVKHPERAGDLLRIVADAMEIAIEILRGQLGASTLFVSPPGLLYWERSLQKIVYLLLEVCKARCIDFAICAPNLRVGAGDLRPAALSYLAYIASVSRPVQSVERNGNSQLTIDDAICYDYAMRMGRLTFDQQGRRLTREATATEREAVRRHNWLVRNNVEIPVREELAEMAKQIGDWPAASAVERTIPQIRFALVSEPVKLPVGLRYIIATESANLKAEVDACSITYAYWYQSRLVNRTLANVASELKLPLTAICTSLGLGWNIDVLAAEFELTNAQADKLLETIGEMTVGKVLALALAAGPTKFVAGPLTLLVEIVVSCDLIMF